MVLGSCRPAASIKDKNSWLRISLDFRRLYPLCFLFGNLDIHNYVTLYYRAGRRSGNSLYSYSRDPGFEP
jgi:hypothetical protein